MSKKRCMVDIETLGTKPGSVILSIGAVKFDKDGLGEEFGVSVDLESCQDAGLTIDADTLEWWLDQDENVQHILTGGIELEDALEQFSEFYGDCTEIWAYSPAFDCVHLERAYEAVGIVSPWMYYQQRDCRTCSKLPGWPETDQKGSEHNALDDARFQAQQTMAFLQKIHD